MKRYFCFLNILAYIFFSCTSKMVGPKLRVEKDSINIGVINIHDSTKVKYVLSNSGDNSIEIKSVGTSCGCSKALISDSIIQPGSTIELQVRFTANDTGYFKKHVVLETNEDSIYKTLTFTGYVLK